MVVAFLLVPFMLVTAFVLDYGMAYAQAQAFASGSDSAALAIAKAKRSQLTANPGLYATCQQLALADGGQSLAIAKKQADANGPFGLTSASSQFDVSVNLKCVDKFGNLSATGMLQADVTVKRQVPTTFGQLAGVSAITATKSSAAAVGAAKSVNGLFPLAICNVTADLIMANAALGAPYKTETIEVDKVWKPGCDVSGNGSGNWGWIDCGGGVSVPALADAITNGCASQFTLSGTPPTINLDGTPGNKINSNNIKTALDGVLGGTYAFPVYTTITGNGANTVYKVIGFIELKIMAYDTNGNIDVQYVSYSPVGQLNTSCGIGVANCASYNTWATSLVN